MDSNRSHLGLLPEHALGLFNPLDRIVGIPRKSKFSGRRCSFRSMTQRRGDEHACGSLNGDAYAGQDFLMRYIIREKFFRLTEDSVIQDERGAPIYQVKGKIFSLHHTLVLMDLAGRS